MKELVFYHTEVESKIFCMKRMSVSRLCKAFAMASLGDFGRLSQAQVMSGQLRGELMAGKCYSIPHQSSEGKLILKESWQWFTGEQTTGTSELEEIVEF